MRNLDRILQVIVVVGLLIGTIFGFFSMGAIHIVPWVLAVSLIAAGLLFKPKQEGKGECDGFLHWSDEYATGIKSIDEDHKKLLNLINNVQACVICNTGEAFERANLDELVSYTIYHFEREEKLMEELDYLNYEAHKGQHDQMILKVQSFIRQYDKNGREALKSVADYLRLWLLQHINQTDQQYVAFFKEKGVR